jgi:hypothetical protein
VAAAAALTLTLGLAGCSGATAGTTAHGGATRPAGATAVTTAPASAAVARAREWSADVLSAMGTVPHDTSVFALEDNLHQPMDCLRVVAVRPGSYLGVYQVGSGSDFVVDLAQSANLRTWREVRTLETYASQPDLVAAGGGFLLAGEATTDGTSHPGVHYISLRYYPDLASLLQGSPARVLNLPHRVAKPDQGIEGTPVIESADLNGSLARSVITISFHYLAPGLVDREAVGVLTDFSAWTAQRDTPLDDALTGAGLAGKHGDRSFVPGTGGNLEVVEAQRTLDSPWDAYLYDRITGTVTKVGVRTPGGSGSFANPVITCVPVPSGTNVALITLFLPNQQAGPGEAGELLYYQPSALCGR